MELKQKLMKNKIALHPKGTSGIKQKRIKHNTDVKMVGK